MRRKRIALGRLRINPWAVPLLIMVGLASIWLGSQIAAPWLATLASVNVLLCGVGIVRSIGGGLRPVAAVFYVFTFGWLGVAPVIQISTGKVAWHDGVALYDPWRVATALGLNVAATVAFMVGAELARNRDANRQAETGFTLPHARVRPLVLAGITLAAVVLLPIAIQANGGLASLFTSRRELTGLRAGMGTSLADIGGPAYAMTRILPGALAVAGALLATYAIRARWTSFSQIKGSHILALAISICTLILFNNPLAYSRFTAAAAFGALFLAWARPRSTRAGFLFVSFMITATLIIYPLANTFRAQDFDVKTGTEAFTSADFDGFQQVINTLNYVDNVGHSFGAQTISGVGFFVPRSLWQSKADPASFAIAENAGYTFTNLSLPIHAEFYLEFGWLGVVAGMAGLGFIAGRLDYAWLNDPGTKLAMIAPYVALATLGIVRGPIGSQIPVWGAVVLLLVLGISQGNSRLSKESFRNLKPRNGE